MSKDSTASTLIVAFVLCLVCSVVVSGAAVYLRPLQEINKTLDQKKNILQVAGLWPKGNEREGVDINAVFSSVEAKLVDLKTGEYVDDVDLDAYDQRIAAKDPKQSRKLSSEEDVASIKRQANYAKVYLLRDGQALDRVILPIHGYGLWSTLYGYVALDSDANTVSAIKFYEHLETPGLGGEIDNPRWQSIWKGKQIYDQDGNPVIRVVKGQGDAASAHQIDGLSGATLTSDGVTNMFQFWLGENGFKPFLDRLRKEG